MKTVRSKARAAGRSFRVLVAVAVTLAAAPARAADGGGTITGIVKWAGKKPDRQPVPGILGNAFCKEQQKGQAPLDDKWVFGKNGAADTLQNVLVYVSKGLEGKTFEPPQEPAVLDQVACIYTPRVVGVMVGQTLEIRNSDATLHNVMGALKKNRNFNEGMAPKGSPLRKVFTKPELKVDFRCFMHPWMLGWVHVLEHPFYAITKSDGTFTIKGLPPGEYEVSVLHESSRFQATPPRATVKVGAGETKRVEFSYRDAGQTM
jgi:plastocyanin